MHIASRDGSGSQKFSWHACKLKNSKPKSSQMALRSCHPASAQHGAIPLGSAKM